MNFESAAVEPYIQYHMDNAPEGIPKTYVSLDYHQQIVSDLAAKLAEEHHRSDGYADAASILNDRNAKLYAALTKARNVWHNYRIDSTSTEDDVLREIDALIGEGP